MLFRSAVKWMDFRQLESFVATVKHGSFTKAAEELYLTQPTITGHVQSLENRLGTVLLNRAGKAVTLTEAGAVLFKYAVNILSTREQALFSLADYEGRLEGELAIASSTVPQRYMLPRLLAAFSPLYPQITFRIQQFDSKGVVEALTSGRMDFGFVGTDTFLPDLEALALCQGRIVLIAPPYGKFGARKATTISWDDVRAENFILREEGSGSRKLFLKGLEQNGVDLGSLSVLATVENPETIKQCVMEGLGVAVVSERSVQEEIRLGLLKGFYLSGFDLKQTFYFVNHKNRVLNPVARAFKTFTAGYFQSP